MCVGNIRSLDYCKLMLSGWLVMSLRIDHHVGIVALAPLRVRGFYLGHHIDLTMRCIPFGNGCNVNKTFPLNIHRDCGSGCSTCCAHEALLNI